MVNLFQYPTVSEFGQIRILDTSVSSYMLQVTIALAQICVMSTLFQISDFRFPAFALAVAGKPVSDFKLKTPDSRYLMLDVRFKT